MRLYTGNFFLLGTEAIYFHYEAIILDMLAAILPPGGGESARSGANGQEGGNIAKSH